MSLLAMLKRKGPSGFGYVSTAEDVTAGINLAGKTILVTGCTAGLGRETIRVLARRGAHILATARTAESAARSCHELGGLTTPLACELSEPASVRACVEQVKTLGLALDAIVCNAGIMALPKLQQRHGVELQFLTNHLGHFILVTGLLDTLAPRGRVVMVSSSAHRAAPRVGIELDNLSGERAYHPWRAYGQSKLANLLFARELARQFGPGGKTANAVHPGVIRTNLARHMNMLADTALAVAGPLMLKSVEQGAATQCYVATNPRLDGVSGRYFADCNERRSSARGEDMELAAQLWQVSEQLTRRIAAVPKPAG